MSAPSIETLTILVEERRRCGRSRRRVISISVPAWVVRRGRSAAVVAKAEQLFAAVQRRGPHPDGPSRRDEP